MDERDQWRQDAMREMASLKAQRRSLVTTNWVLAETYTGLVDRIARGAIARLRAMVEGSTLVRVIWIDRLLEELAWRKFLQYDDKDVSMVDCTSFVVMEQLGLSTAFTFDRHFLQVGFQTWTEL
jgi:predicted nucleic acid-binding protein